MTTTTRTTNSLQLTRLAATVAGLAALALAVYQVATPGAPEATYNSPSDWIREALFQAYLAGSILAVNGAARHGLAPRAAVRLVSFGYGLVFVGVAAGMVLREDPDWFVLLGVPGNLLAIAGFITWAIWARRTKVWPLTVALLCGVGGPVAVLGSEMGLGVLIASFWLYLAKRMR